MKAPVATALSALLLVAGCGGSSDKAPTLAKANAAGAAINLKADDLPSGFTGTPHKDDSSGNDSEKDFETCVGVSSSDADQVADVFSDDFTRGQEPAEQDVSSDVAVIKDKKVAKTQLKALQSDKAKTCLVTVMNKLIAEQTAGTPGLTASTPVVTSLKPDGGGMDGVFGFELSLTIGQGAIQLPVHLTMLGGLKKHSQISLEVMAIGEPVSESDRDAMWHTLITRAGKSAV